MVPFFLRTGNPGNIVFLLALVPIKIRYGELLSVIFCFFNKHGENALF